MAKVLAKNETATDLLIYGEIGESWWWGDDPITGKSVAAALKNIPAGRPINLRINSSGGDVGEALAIYNLLSERRSDVTTYIDGYALSAASFIALAGHRVISPPSSIWMLHNPHTIAFGDCHAMRKAAEILDTHRDALLSIYADRTGQDEVDIIAALDDETWFTGAEAVDFGLATELADEDLPAETTAKNYIPPLFRAAATKADREKIAALGWKFQPTRRKASNSYRFKPVAANYQLKEEPEPMANSQSQSQPPENSELLQIRNEVAALRTNLAETTQQLDQTLSTLAARDAEILNLQRRAAIANEYSALRRQAEALNRDGKLSKVQFAKLFGNDPAADIEALAADENYAVRLGRIEGAIDVATAAEASLQTEFRTESSSTEQHERGEEAAEPATVQAARESIENAWRTK